MEWEQTASAAIAGGARQNRFGFWASVLVAASTAATFALAVIALPNRVPYPFTDPVIAAQWPWDYLWLYAAMLQLPLVVVFVAAVHTCAPPAKRVHSLLGLCFAVASAMVLLADYYLQANVMPLSLEKGQLDGWAMLTMYNPNGVFIALEELGYLLIGVAFLCLAPAFVGKTVVARMLRWLLRASFAASLVALVAVSATRGLDRGDSYEILVISIVWLTLIAAGVLAAGWFRRAPSASSA